ncbi:MAG: sulfotransferase domain-containing protein [Chitinophagales bacterium]|nr:hypothetical protein [Bacteroidota bacterium]HPE97451.1 sulfotransferase domain-containing protein [Chitinophagales bacterium]HPR28996.1 sulfotransferase domain-containing protein [Chitinophagales bacterium]HQU39199.1 sulfotransferase domain-containing protein [Chitinophagales bacterium]HQU76155.1 sulfotransferase domain-containing protein [Chitinophagales bacterium]
MATLRSIQTFLCIGVQKAGTTTLADILATHPDICIPEVKETKFFYFAEDYSKGIDHYNHTFYRGCSEHKAVGELDPDYIMHPEAAGRVRETLGDGIKLIVVFRDPARRAYSQYLMSRKKGIEKLGFNEALSAEDSRRNWPNYKTVAYVERGLYATQLKRWLELFPRTQFLFLDFEKDIVQQLPETLRHIQEFLGVSVLDLDHTIRSNEASEAVNDSVRDMVRRPNFVKTVLKKLIPSARFRKKARRFMIERNQQAASASRLEEEEAREINRKYFAEEIAGIRELTGLPFEHWSI